MNRSVVLLIGALAWWSPAAGQTRIGIRAGAIASSTLVRDSIVQAFTVRSGPGGTIGFEIQNTLNARYRVSASLTSAWGHLQRHESGATTEIVPLSTWTPAVTLYRHLLNGLAAYATVGAIIYRADRNAANLFRRGSSPMPLVGAGLSAARPLGNGLQLTVSLGYDVHRFKTPALEDAGFNGERTVHRVGVNLGVSRGL